MEVILNGASSRGTSRGRSSYKTSSTSEGYPTGSAGDEEAINGVNDYGGLSDCDNEEPARPTYRSSGLTSNHAKNVARKVKSAELVAKAVKTEVSTKPDDPKC